MKSIRYLLLTVLALLPPALCAQTATDFLRLSPADYPVTADRTVPLAQCTWQFTLPAGIPVQAVRLRVEYPEYAPLTATERKALRTRGTEVGDTLAYALERHTVRGRGVVDVAVLPFVRRGGQLVRATSLRLSLVYKDGSEVRRVPGLAQVCETVRRIEAQSRYAEKSVLAEGKWAKISVTEEGFYALSPSFLASAGFSDPSRVKIYGYGGRMLPEAYTLDGSTGLIDDLCEQPLIRRSDGTLVFFAEGTVRWTWNASSSKWTHAQHLYATASHYFLTEGDAPAEMQTLDAPASAGSVHTTAPLHALWQKQEYAWYGGGRDYHESTDFASTSNGRRTFTLALPGIVEGSTSKVDWDISAASSSSVKAQLSFGGDVLSTVTISKVGDNETARGYRTTCQATGLTASSAFVVSVPTGISARFGYLRVNYTGTLSAATLSQSFSPCFSGSGTLEVSDATSDVSLLRIGEGIGESHAWTAATLDGTTLRATVSDGMARYVLYNARTSYPAPTLVGTVANQNLHGQEPVQYVVLVPESGKLESEARRLAEAHEAATGITTRVQNVAEVYNEFSSGTPDATAVRRYLKMLYEKGSDAERPTHLLLFGDCAWDNRMVTSTWKSYDPKDFLLGYESGDELTKSSYSIGTLHSYVSDDYYALLEDGKGTNLPREKMDLAVGRFPVHRTEEAATMVDKAIAYLQNKEVGVWKNQLYMIADAGNENLHMKDAEAIATQVSTTAGAAFRVHKIYPDAYNVTSSATGITYPEASQRIIRQMTRGALIFNYTGHGAPDRLSHQSILFNTDMAANKTSALPLWIFASCEITPFDEQEDDLGRSALYNKNGGAVSVICAARSVYATYNRYLDVHFMRHALVPGKVSDRYTMGQALCASKNTLITPSAETNNVTLDNTINKNKYALLGDPALPLTYPEHRIVVDSINGQTFGAQDVFQLRAGEVVRFSGYIQTEGGNGVDTSFNGDLTGTLFDREETITCKNYDNSTSDPMQFNDRTKVLFEGTTTVRAGRFDISAVIPRTISYTNDLGMLSLYAVNDDHSLECNGVLEQFFFNGTDETLVDTLGPRINPYFLSPDFADGGTIPSSATTLFATVSDDTGIYSAGAAMGHSIELVLDGDNANPIALDDYFTYDFGSYNSGLVSYPLESLAAGRHTLQLKVWDVVGNSSTATLNFRVRDGETLPAYVISATENPTTTDTRFVLSFPSSAEGESSVRIEVYSTSGQRVWHTSGKVPAEQGYFSTTWRLTNDGGAPVGRGVYLYRAVVNGHETDAKKIIVF